MLTSNSGLVLPHNHTHHTLGRRQSFDPRDSQHLMSAIQPPITPVTPITYKYHVPGPVLNQLDVPACVGYAWAGLRIGSPSRLTLYDPVSIYKASQVIDEWPGENYSGTSVRAGAKVMQSLGFITSYSWSFTLQPIIDWVLTTGPVVLGTNWYTGMYFPDRHGLIHLTGSNVGGHAYVMNGVNTTRGVARFMNSWGRLWGKRGHFYMTLEDLQRLIQEDGEACSAHET